MKFIREMIARKNRSPEMDVFADELEFDVDDTEEDPYDSAPPVSIQSIQARLQNALVKGDDGTTTDSDPDSGRAPVDDFRDVVRDRSTPEPIVDDPQDSLEADESDTDELGDIDLEMAMEEDAVPPKPPVASAPSEQPRASSDKTPSSIESQDDQSSVRATSTPIHQPAVASIRPTPSGPETADTSRPAAASDQSVPQPQSSPETQESHKVDDPDSDMADTTEDDPSAISDRMNKSGLGDLPQIPPAAAPMVEVPAPAAGRSGRRAGRVKTRLLGFEHAHGSATDPFEAAREDNGSSQGKFPVGWMVVIKGLGRGSSFMLNNGVSQIGRGEDQAIRLDFGDSSISRNNHAAIAYDAEQRLFFIGHGGKANLVRLNNKPVLSTEELADGDLIRIGETVLQFVALCGPDFDWEIDEESDEAAIA